MTRSVLVADRMSRVAVERSTSRGVAWFVVTIWMALGWITVASAQTSSWIPDANGVTAEALNVAIETAATHDGLDETTRSRVVDQLRQAQTHLRNRQSAEAAAASYAATLRSAPRETQRLRSQLDEVAAVTPTAESLGIDDRTATSVVEGALTSALVELAAAEAQLAGYDAEAAAEADRPAEIREQLAALRARDASTAPVPPVGEPEALGAARRLAAQLEQDARTADLRRLEQELLSHGVRLNLLGARRDDTAREILDTRRRVDVLQSEVNDRRQRLADQAREEAALAELAAADEHPAVRELAEDNAKLTRELPAVATEIQRLTEALGLIEARAREVEQSLARSLERLELGGVNQLLGRLLVEQQRNLPRASRLRAEMRERRRTLADVSLAQIEAEEQRRGLTPIDLGVERVMARAADISDPDERRSIQQDVERLLRNRRDLLQQMAASYASQAGLLNEVDLAQSRLLDAAADYERFLDRNVLWIPSATLFGPESIRHLLPALGWLVDPASWATAVTALGVALRHSLIGTLGALFALGLALYFRRSLAGAVVPNDREAPTIRHTLAALALAALRALPLPFLMAVLAWALQRSPTLDDFSAAAGAALSATASFLYSALLLRTLAARDGVLRAHFDWSTQRLELLRRQANRLAVFGVPLAWISALAYSGSSIVYGESLGRLAFVLLLVLVSGVAFALLHPVRGIVVSSGEDGPSPLLRLVHAVAVGAPLLLALASIIGYSYTALTLAGHLIATYWLGLGLYLGRLVAWRWLTLAGSDLEARDPDADVTDDAAPDVGPGDDVPIVAPTPPPDFETVDRQSKRLLDAGLVFVALVVGWAIWSHVLPALGVLDRTALWPQTVVVDGEEATVPVTLADLFLALLVAGVTLIAARNLPGLMEIAVLQRATLQPGSRYAINTLLRYVIVVIGTITAFGVLGWRWSQIQWLAAAISVGLGFGLQEIVANFVSGLVILFERPVRVGDTVTVGPVTGTISRIRIRATTITDWDRKEIIVPNKALITEQVINWTLTDPITRIVIPVGIGYGSDVEQARDVMDRALHDLPLVLDEPSPQVYFVGFGDSSLDFKLHVFARQLSERMPLIHAVHEAVLQALRDAGIEIPFPQRDLHMK